MEFLKQINQQADLLTETRFFEKYGIELDQLDEGILDAFSRKSSKPESSEKPQEIYVMSNSTGPSGKHYEMAKGTLVEIIPNVKYALRFVDEKRGGTELLPIKDWSKVERRGRVFTTSFNNIGLVPIDPKEI